MTDVVEAVAALVGSGAIQGLSGHAAIEAVSGIKKRIREVFGQDIRAVAALEGVDEQPTDPDRLVELAAALRWYAQRDEQFAADLNSWASLGEPRIVQNVRAQGNAYVAGRDQTVIHYNSDGDTA